MYPTTMRTERKREPPETSKEGGSGAPDKPKRKRVERPKVAIANNDKKKPRKSVGTEPEDAAPTLRKPRLKKRIQCSHSSDESCSGDEVDSEHIIESRLRTRVKLSRRDFLLENLKCKKRGLPPLQSEPDTSDDSDDSESSWDSLFDEDSDASSQFIVEDNGSAAAPLPKEFSMVAHEGLSHQFKKIFQVHLAIRPQVEHEKFMKDMLQAEEYFSIPLTTARRRISSIRDSLVSFCWTSDFTEILAKYPELKMEDLPSARAAQCDVCNIQGRRGYRSGKLSGIPYNPTGFREIDDDKKHRKKDSKLKVFNVGLFCAERVQVFHKICHWEYELFKSISHEVDKLHEAKQSSGVFNDRDVFVPIKEHNIKDMDDADAIYEWLDQRNKVEIEWQKIKLILEQAQNVDSTMKRGKTD
ncbi:hypothetical protein DFH08DRAFT_903539 [Mycena albidolilacea]|uniref:DUF4211 domain-containing protein n=1 Tax=Mycena albidolilacea TaxID=1033008 RepID=A0AAD6Z267_9AGAR|nr:hypothetical protein DFH08DRAFT_903539 [Mycena albidolilacea]